MDFKKFLASRTFAKALLGMSALIVALVIFQAGVALGRHKTLFTCGWAEHYQRDFGMPGDGFMPRRGMMRDPNGHGAIGDIFSISLPTIAVRALHEPEKIVVVGSGTLILRGNSPITPADLKLGDHVVVIGQPNAEGEVEAKLIRVFVLASASSTP